MTKKLAELLNLPQLPDGEENADISIEETKQFIQDNQATIDEVDDAIGKIDAALPTVRGLDTGDEELDELSKLAKDKAEDLIDLGMNMDPRFAGVIMQTAGVMLGHAISAKTAKLDKKLKMINLQLQKAKLDHQIKKDQKVPTDDPVDGEGIVLDRNELLSQILGKQTK